MYLSGYLSSEYLKLAVFDPMSNELEFEQTYSFKEDFNLQSTLIVFLEQYEGFLERKKQPKQKRKDTSDKKIKHTVIAAGGPTGGEILKVSHLGINLEINIHDISLVLENRGHSPIVNLLNDFESLAYGMLFFDETGYKPADIKPLSGGHKDLGKEEDDKIISKKTNTVRKSLVIGPDKGLGVASIAYGAQWNGLPYIETSEGGHSTFAPEWEDAVKLVQHIQKTQSNEDFLSHRGIKEIYNYFHFERENSPNYKVSYSDIISSAFSGNDNAAVSTVRFFCEALGALCGNMANIFNCNYSIFLWSATLQVIPNSFLCHHFQKRFSSRPRFGEKIEKIPVFLIMEEHFPLYGCAYYSFCYLLKTHKEESPDSSELETDSIESSSKKAEQPSLSGSDKSLKQTKDS